ncbi:MAG: DUF3237 domain-containing protein [Solobacterium sp.]|nr:DUF3237 domain-containing protein [Solobacterium sp.]
MAEPLMIFHIRIERNRISEVNTPYGSAKMIPFGGYTESDLFRGTIQPGACDVQTVNAAGVRHMCAKYMFKGTDCDGRPCSLYVENDGWFTSQRKDGIFDACPVFMTDSPALAEILCRPVFRSEGHPAPGGVDILIFRADEKDTGEKQPAVKKEDVPAEIREAAEAYQGDPAAEEQVLGIMEKPFKELVYFTGANKKILRMHDPDFLTVCALCAKLRGTVDMLFLLREDEALAALTCIAGRIRNIENDSLAILEAVLEDSGEGLRFGKRASSLPRIRIKPF